MVTVLIMLTKDKDKPETRKDRTVVDHTRYFLKVSVLSILV